MASRTVFQHALEDLKVSLEEMGAYVENLYERLFVAIGAGDRAAIRMIMKEDRNINDMERNLESRCLSLITRQQPIARDLRVITATLKIVADLERIGDQVADIGELVLRFDDPDIFRYSVHLAAMSDSTKEHLIAAMECFLNRDMETAETVIEEDDIIDDLFNKVKGDVVRFLRNGDFPADECIDIMMIAKYLEKIGDHANHIAEWECFQETGNIHNTRLL